MCTCKYNPTFLLYRRHQRVESRSPSLSGCTMVHRKSSNYNVVFWGAKIFHEMVMSFHGCLSSSEHSSARQHTTVLPAFKMDFCHELGAWARPTRGFCFFKEKISTMYYVTTLIVICHADLFYVMHKSPNLFSIVTFRFSPRGLQAALFSATEAAFVEFKSGQAFPLTSIKQGITQRVRVR